jgi:hypothetical protein
MPLHYQHDFRPCLAYLRTPPLRFGRRPPQSNCLPCTVPRPDNGRRLEPQTNQGGISTTAPRDLAAPLQSLPPILHRSVHSPMQSYSKGSWGLSVLPRGDCIITNISTSLSLGRRQCGHRYAIRAGRNLPDKEFRYLRTVQFVTRSSLLVICSTGRGHFCRALCVAAQFGLSHPFPADRDGLAYSL